MPKDPTMHHAQRGSNYTGANSGRGSRANANKKKKAKKMIVPMSPAEPRKQWWEIWEEVQNRGVKTFVCDQDVHVYDKMYLATDTFNKSRSWPATETQVRARWDQFQVYVGLLTNAAGDELDRLAAFVRDPARTVQVYLSSYMIHKGLHFTGHFCDIIPRLLSFYVNFLITNQVLPDQEPNLRLALEVTELARVELPLFPLIAHACPDNLNLACKEVFSATPRLTKDLSANATGGTGLEVPSGTASIAEDSEAVSIPTMNVTCENEGSNKVARKEKKKKSKSKNCKRNEEQDIFQDSNELKDEKSTVGQGPASEMSGWGDTCGWAMNAVTSTQDGDDENNGSSIWGTSIVSHDPSTGGWGEASSNYGAGSWGSPHDEQNTTNSWAEDTDISAPGLGTFTLPPPASSFVPASIIGPTGLPATHVGGIVEYSIRRIKDIRPMDLTDLPMNPAQTVAQDQPHVKSESESESEISSLGPAAIETELKQKYWRVTLAPWLHPWGHPADSVNGASYLPRILASTMGRLGNIQSPGFLTDALNTVSAVVEKGAVVDLNVGSVKPHDPFIDDVVIFLEEEACKTMRVGMGLGGTWVQLLWKSDVEVKMEVDSVTEGRETRFWYMQDLLSNLTSYHIV